VAAAVDALRDELLDVLARAIRIPSVTPTYPGQVFDDLVGAEGDVSHLLARVYAEAGAEVDVFGLAPGRENAVGVLAGAGGGRSLLFNGHVDVVPVDGAGSWHGGDPFSGAVADGHRPQ
jgi:acetylornithine deacetylase